MKGEGKKTETLLVAHVKVFKLGFCINENGPFSDGMMFNNYECLRVYKDFISYVLHSCFRIHLLAMPSSILLGNRILRWEPSLQGIIQTWEWKLSINRYIFSPELL